MGDRKSTDRRIHSSRSDEKRRYERKPSREVPTILESARKHAQQENSDGSDHSVSLEDDGIEVKWGRPNLKNYKKIVGFHLSRSYVILHGMFPYDSTVNPGIRTQVKNNYITVVALDDDSCLKDFIFKDDRILALNEQRMTDNNNFQLVMSNYHGHFEMLIERLKEPPQKRKSYREIPIKLDESDSGTSSGGGENKQQPSRNQRIVVRSDIIRVKPPSTGDGVKTVPTEKDMRFSPRALRREVELLSGKKVPDVSQKKRSSSGRFSRLKRTFEKAKRKQRKLFGKTSYHRKSTRLERVTMANFPRKQAKLIAKMKKAPLPLDIQQVFENRLLLLTTQLRQANVPADSSQAAKDAIEESPSQTISSEELSPKGVEVSRDVEHHQIQSDVSRKKKLKRVGR
ncbi:hypothetical protein M513_06740 [Trichuris suis]|uniref:Uncharacterized protein n=2 Tax=Trichuris suis TaxID=68888 RepID=A0A085M563_9BILA|nr:hypothetical protein M513_06740 [Trichuris suis]